MIQRVFLFFFFSIQFFAIAQNKDSVKVNDFSFFTDYPNIYKKYGFFENPEEYWEVLSDNVHNQLEAGGHYNTPDEYNISIWGSSFLINDYSINNFPINSIASTGSVLHKLKLYDKNLKIDDYSYHIQFNNEATDTASFLRVSQTLGNAGGRIWGANTFVNKVVGHSSSFDRKIQDFSSRRSLPLMTSVYFQKYLKGNFIEKVNASLDFGKRTHLNFGLYGLESDFNENFALFNLQLQSKQLNKTWVDKVYLNTSFKNRDNLYAEYNYNEQETAKETALALSVYGKKDKENFNHTFGFNYALKHRKMNEDTIYRNKIDLDGEGFEPYHPNAITNEFQFISKGNFKLNNNLNAFWDARENIIGFNAMDKNSVWNLYAEDSVSNYTSYYQYTPKSDNFVGFLPSNRIGLKYLDTKSKVKKSFEFSLHHSSLLSKNTSLNSISPDYKLQFDFPISKSSTISFATGKNSFAYSFYQMQLLENNYLSGNFNYWNDANNNRLSENGELNGIYDNTTNIRADGNLPMSQVYYLEIPFEHKTHKKGRTHHFGIIPQLKSFRNTWRVQFDGENKDYGYFDEEGIYHLNKNPNYLVTSYPKELMNQFGGDNWFLDQPFYAGVDVKYAFENKKVYTSISLFTYLAMGMGSIGNGVYSNSTGTFSTTTANPNTLIESLGRTHTDRSIIVKYNFMKKVNKNFTYGVSVKYKDGESFSAFLNKNGNNGSGKNEFLIWNEGLPGDNPFLGGRDKREDAYYSVDLRLNYSFLFKKKPLTLELRCYNILDLGLEINEYTFRPFTDSKKNGYYDNNSRAALEIQTPRTVEIGLKYNF